MAEQRIVGGSSKRFVYLFQVAGELPTHLEQAAGPDSDIVFLSWRTPSADPRSVHYPSSSWTQGRNRLLKEVLGRDYEYFIFADDDVRLSLTPLGRRAAGGDANPWRVFEEFLLTHQPAVGCTHYTWHLRGGAHDPAQDVQTLRFFDAILNAFHREALTVLLPYYDRFDELSETYSQNLLCSLAAELYPGHVLQTNRIQVVNLEARRGAEEFLLSRPEQFFLECLCSDLQRSAFRRQTYEEMARHPTWGAPTPKRESYQRDDSRLATLFDLQHPFWTRRRELLALPLADPFLSSDGSSARAMRWRAFRARSRGQVAPVPRVARVATMVVNAIERHGLKTSRHYVALRDLYRAWRGSFLWRALTTSLAARVPPDQVWREWHRTPASVLEIPEHRQQEGTELLANAMNALAGDSVVFVDVGAGAGHVMGQLRLSSLHKQVLAIGIDPVDLRAHLSYGGFVAAAVTDGPEGFADFFVHEQRDASSLKRMVPGNVTHTRSEGGAHRYYSPLSMERVRETVRVPTYRLSTLLRQYGLDREVLHFVKIDAQGSDLEVVRSLEDLLEQCLFLRMESVVHEDDGPPPLLYEGQSTMREDRAFLEAAGFRLFCISRFGVTPEADLTFVNQKLFEELIPQWTR